MTNVVEHSMTQRELLWAAVLDEINILKAKGATDADFQERATYELLWHNALAKRWQAVRNDMRTSQEVWEVVIELATPECLRDLADLAREWVPRLPESLRAAANDCAYNLELLADQKERGSYVLELDAIRVLAYEQTCLQNLFYLQIFLRETFCRFGRICR